MFLYLPVYAISLTLVIATDVCAMPISEALICKKIAWRCALKSITHDGRGVAVLICVDSRVWHGTVGDIIVIPVLHCHCGISSCTATCTKNGCCWIGCAEDCRAK